MMSDMVERVARALYPKIKWAYRFGPVPFDSLNEFARNDLRECARIAIAEMRKPSDSMLVAGLREGVLAEYTWRAMIDEALKE